jgi:hypothetical protein
MTLEETANMYSYILEIQPGYSLDNSHNGMSHVQYLYPYVQESLNLATRIMHIF